MPAIRSLGVVLSVLAFAAPAFADPQPPADHGYESPEDWLKARIAEKHRDAEKILAELPLLRGGETTPRPGDDEHKLLAERHNALWRVVAKYEVMQGQNLCGVPRGDECWLLRVLQELADVKYELSAGREELAAVQAARVTSCRTLEKRIIERAEGGLIRPMEVDFARAVRLDAEARLIRLKAPVPPPKAEPVRAWTDDELTVAPVDPLHRLLVEKHNALVRVVQKHREWAKNDQFPW